RYFITGELNTPVSDVALKLQQVKERFGAEGEVSHLDGVSVDAPDWHMNVRPSNTEPLLRLNLEARSRQLMERKRDAVLDVIRSCRACPARAPGPHRSSPPPGRASASRTPTRRESSTTAATSPTSTWHASSTCVTSGCFAATRRRSSS